MEYNGVSLPNTKNFTWIYDYNNKTILARSELKDHEKLELTNYLKANFDIYRYKDGRLIVKEVVIGSTPWNEGLRPSMTIVKINGRDITEIKVFNVLLSNIPELFSR